MKRSYLLVSALGISVGLLTILLSSALNLESVDGWDIPLWDHCSINTRPEFFSLQHWAVFLRAVKIFLDHGILYLTLPTLAGCGVLKLHQLGNDSRLFWCLSRSLEIAIVTVFCVVFTLALGAAANDAGAPPYSETRLLEVLEATLFMLSLVNVSFIGPAFWLLVFLVSLKRTKRLPPGAKDLCKFRQLT